MKSKNKIESLSSLLETNQFNQRVIDKELRNIKKLPLPGLIARSASYNHSASLKKIRNSIRQKRGKWSAKVTRFILEIRRVHRAHIETSGEQNEGISLVTRKNDYIRNTHTG